MEQKVEEILKSISETGYKSYDNVVKEFSSLVADYKTVRPQATEEALQAHVLNVIWGKCPHPSTFRGYIIGFDREFDKNEKTREAALKAGNVNENGQPIYLNMPEKKKFLEEQPIPTPEESTSRVCSFIGTIFKEGQEENWKRAKFWLKKKGLVPPQMALVEFKGAGNFSGTVPTIGSLDGTTFKVLTNEKINFGEMAASIMSENVCSFAEVATFEQPEDFPVIIFKGQVVRATITKDAAVNNPVELRMPAETLEDVLKADNVANLTLWCDKAVPIDFSEGDIVWAVTNKYIKQDGSFSMKGLGFYLEQSSFPKNKPIPLTEQNAKIVPAQDHGEDFGDKA